jgi:hypothetical protein
MPNPVISHQTQGAQNYTNAMKLKINKKEVSNKLFKLTKHPQACNISIKSLDITTKCHEMEDTS